MNPTVDEPMLKQVLEVMVQIRDLKEANQWDKGLLSLLELYGDPFELIEDYEAELER